MNDGFLEHAVLALYPFSRGFAYVLFEGPTSPFAWDIREIKEKHKSEKTLAEIKALIGKYLPMVVVIEEEDGKCRRGERIKKLYRKIVKLAEKEDMGLYRFTYEDILEHFMSMPSATKREIALAVAKKIPGFAHRMPPPRKAWMSQDPRQALFDAAALGLTFYSVWSPDGGEGT